LARGFWLYQKKRGNRRTGSQKLGSVGEAIFFAVCFLLGCGGLVTMFATLVIPEWRANYEFLPHRCVVVDKRLGQKDGDEGPLYRPEVQIEYQVRGETYRIWTYDIWTFDVRGGYSPDKAEQQAALSRFVVDPRRPVDCWYDPADPKVGVLVRGSGWLIWLAFSVPLSFLAIGGGGLTYTIFTWGKSAERYAALVQRTARLAPFRNVAATAPEYPNIPVSTNITNSPGTVLAFRLPVSGATAWGLFVTLLTCIFWNGVVSIFAGIAINGHRSGNPDWHLTLFVVPFALVGVALILFFVRKFLATTGIGPTLVEISAQPLYPGQCYRVFLQQFGRLKINRLEVLLVCEEEATFRHGTDTRMESRLVAQQALMLCENVEVRHGVPFETDCDLEVPRGAMHSFKSQHNEVNWKVQVRLDVAGWPAYERSFPVIVYPPPVAAPAERLPAPASRVVEKRPVVHGSYGAHGLPADAPIDRGRPDAREGQPAASAAEVNAGVGAGASGA
jgi:hypothetical protein